MNVTSGRILDSDNGIPFQVEGNLLPLRAAEAAGHAI